MKKYFNIAMAALLGVSMAACSDDDPELGMPQVNPQEALMPAEGITAADAVADGGSVNLTSGNVKMIDITELENFPASSKLAVVMSVSATQDMAVSRDLDLEMQSATDGTAIYSGYALATEWTEAFRALVSRDPAPRSMWVSYKAYAFNDNQRVLLGSIGEKQEVIVTPMPLEHVIESEYYVFDGNFATAVRMDHSGNVYDHPEFSAVLELAVSQIPYKFQIIPESTKNAANSWEQNQSYIFYGPDGETAMAASTSESEAQWFTINQGGRYLVTVDMWSLTYKIQPAAEYLYVPGGGNGWSFTTMLASDNYINYRGFAYLSGEFKFTDAPDWGAPGNYGNAGDNTTLQNGSNSNFSVDGSEGLYYLSVDLGQMNYTKSAISTIAIIGSIQDVNWDHGKSIVMTPDDATMLTWSATVTFAEGNEWKFAMNRDWAINLGAADEEGLLKFDGGNIKVEASDAGIKTVHLDLSTVPYQYWIE